MITRAQGTYGVSFVISSVFLRMYRKTEKVIKGYKFRNSKEDVLVRKFHSGSSCPSGMEVTT